MPRKIKTAFTATDEDVAITGIHDIGFIPRVRDGVRGVEMRVGGGTSIMPRIAPTLYEFVELDNGDFLKVTEAVFRLFDRQEWLRVNRARARIKVLIDKIGIDAFREMVEEELEGDWVAETRLLDRAPAARGRRGGERPRRPRRVRVAERRQLRVRPLPRVERRAAAPGRASRRSPSRSPAATSPRSSSAASARSCASTPAATPARPCSRTSSCAGSATSPSTTSGSGSSELGLGDAGAMEVTDVVSCPGTDSCKLGITSSMGLNAAIQERLETMDVTDPDTRRVNVKMSGCPNGCGQHHIGNIGFYGASIKVGEKTIPAYIAHIGGNFEGGEVVYGTRLKVRLPAKRVPDAVERWLGCTRPSATTASASTPSPSGSAPSASPKRSRTWRARSSSGSRRSTSSSTGAAPSPTRSSAAKESAQSDGRRGDTPPALPRGRDPDPERERQRHACRRSAARSSIPRRSRPRSSC